ncbi:hypothetical protein [Nocardioides sp. YIM 152315]|uniref:hypothetical protein n=1 Tax=Nocardioides sp. YIM 152315 TaxID=3031760 RepID=UPI0023DC04A6|nr:hypothetical protein [Nocardioides sp. YIM 152315]MDF1604637.1 hypothetical protein [Nocardioides sp. YIM 152315]
MTTLRLRAALATVGGDLLPQPYVCDDLDAAVRLGADVYVGAAVGRRHHREAWWRKMREAGHETYHRHDDAPISTRLDVVHPWTAGVRLAVGPPTQVLGPRSVSRRRLDRARSRGVTSIIAADLGGCAPAYHPGQLAVAHHGSLWIVVVPAADVDVVVARELIVPPADLHGGAALAVDLELGRESGLRGAPGYEAVRAAGRRPPLPVGHGARAAR